MNRKERIIDDITLLNCYQHRIDNIALIKRGTIYNYPVIFIGDQFYIRSADSPNEWFCDRIEKCDICMISKGIKL